MTFLLALSLFPLPRDVTAYEQVYGLIDVRTTFSDGDYSIDGLVQLAKERGFGAIFITDHDRTAMSYGLPPFRNILKKTEEHNSINYLGSDNYLRAIQTAQKKYPDMIIIPGSETAPFYYWTGDPLNGLTAHDHEKRLLVLGMVNPEDYRDMPILHNQTALTWDSLDGPSLIFLGTAILSVILICWPGRLRLAGAICLPLSLLLLIDGDPLRTSPFDAYSGDQGIAPYQHVIEYVNNRGGMTFWNYPETRSGIRKLGPIQVSTKPYPGVLQASRGYTGFAALYGENATVTEPGNLWDLTLSEYCRGYRMWPPWGIATADYHGEGKDGAKLGNYPTVFLVKGKTGQDILKAMQTGKMYACQTTYPMRPRLDEFSVSSPDGVSKGISGDEITITGHPKIRISLSASGTSQAVDAKVRLIRSGRVVSTFEGKLPMNIEHEDPYYQRGEKIYYRMDAGGGAGNIIANPIFVTFGR